MKKQKIVKFIVKLWKEWRLTIFFIVFVVVPVKSSLADWNWVPTGSMNPTILEGDLLYINKLAYDLRFPLTWYRIAKWSEPKRGDIVILFSPEDETRLVKRIVAVPGDKVEMKNNVIFLNDQPLTYSKIDSKYTNQLASKIKGRPILATENLDGNSHVVMSTPSIPAVRNFGPITVPQGKYFVMGDNRDNSRDSRYFGFVERQAIIGKAKGVILSFDITDKFQPRFSRFFSSVD
ncbi:MAG: signal peptidase I [Planctomycetes bacterium RBG_13_44_8b]|nr:MAG: signal peptidase I [Planctomycetes bacterium RBG_13_44_8b]